MNGGPGTEADGSGYDYRNALVINLHGEMVPMPPMRNYSDPAKRPEAGTAAHRMYRIVSHPENIHAASGAEVRLRVYPFVADPNDTADFPNSGATFAAGYTPTIVITSTATNSNTVRTALLQVGVNHNVEFLPGNYTWRAAVSGGANDYDVSVINSSQTLVTLYNSPIRHAPSGNYGLASTARLYGLEYIPCVVSGTSFSDVFTQPNAAGTLAENSATNAKNTARWVLRFPAGTFADGLVTFETRLNATLTEGYPGSYPSNMSRTYCWVGSTSTVPASEQSQFIGDPRHMPYADVKASLRYNWFFKDVNGGGLGYSSFVPDTGATLWDGFGADTSTPYSNHSCIDVPRFYEVLRKALLKTTSVMNSINGWSFYYLGIGGEIGVDANNSGYDSSVSGMPIMGQPWNPQDSAKRGVDEISEWNGASGKITDARIIAHSSDGTTTSTDWFGLFWIGELYPTMNAVDASAQWIANGNLRTGDGGFPNNQKRYFRAEYNNGNLSMGSYANTAVLSYGPRKEPGTFGAPSFFNDTTGTSSSHTNFNHSSPSNTADLTVAGSAVSQDFNFPLPSPLTSVSNNHRPFSQTDASAAPTEWDQASYYTQRATETIVETYYDSSNSGMNTSVLLNFTQGSQYGYFQPTGVAPQGTFGTAEIGKLALINVIRGFLTAGVSTTTAANIPQVPLVSISSPAITDEFNSPTSITIIWGSTWTRWDGQNYTSAYSGSYSGPTLTYNVKYTSDAGSHWYFLNTNVPAKEGLLNNSYAVTSPVVWNVSDPAAFPQGNYDVEVEAYRNTRALHYSYHRRQVFIKR